MSEQTPKQTRKDIEAHIIAQAWKDEAYKQELFSNPKAAIEREFNVILPKEMNVQVLEENSITLYFVLPMRPDLSEADLSDEQLEAVAGGTIGEIYDRGKDFGDTVVDTVQNIF